jgi:hypothetical protein
MNEGKIPPIRRLCEMASHPDDAIAATGQSALFPGLIEPLNDSFDPAACDRYDRVMAEIIDYFRRLPEAHRLDQALNSFGLETEADLLARKSQVSNLRSQIPDLKSQIRKILLLSRVTIGADVTITSVIIAALRAAHPGTEMVLLGGPKLRELYDDVRIREIRYGRGARVLSRLMSWLDVVEAVEEETHGLSPEEVLIIDPDSRLTQLGLLPVVRDERNYYFFESRRYRAERIERLGELTARWVNECFGLSGAALPFLSLSRDRLEFGRKIAQVLGASQIVAVSLGVGGNDLKRISESFEQDLIRLVARNAALILDAGATPSEIDQVNRLVVMLEQDGKQVIRLNPQNVRQWSPEASRGASVVIWQGGVGDFAGLIAASDLYIGYDSAGQHLAAALGVPTLTVFVNSNAPVFAERWRPSGPGPVDVIEVPAKTAHAASEAVLERVEESLGKSRKV